jgi:hypothetical protein
MDETTNGGETAMDESETTNEATTETALRVEMLGTEAQRMDGVATWWTVSDGERKAHIRHDHRPEFADPWFWVAVDAQHRAVRSTDFSDALQAARELLGGAT